MAYWAKAFSGFLAGKVAAAQSADPDPALLKGLGNDVSFSSAGSQLYVVLMSRFLQGAKIPAAERPGSSFQRGVQTIAEQQRQAMTHNANLVIDPGADQVNLAEARTAPGRRVAPHQLSR